MPIPDNKIALLEAIHVNYKKLVIDLADIPTPLTTKVELDGHAKGTKMSICNLVSYLIGWQKLVLKWHQKKQLNQQVHFPETGFKWNELGLLAQRFYKDYEHLEYPQLLEKLEVTTNEVLQLIEAHSNEALYGKNWYEKYTFGRMIQLNTASPFLNARKRVRKWKKTRSL